MSIFLGLLNLVLILTSVSLVLVVLMQKTKDGGMGAALGGGATESAFGHETGNVLSKFTINAAIAFFVLAFMLYLGRIYEHKHPSNDGSSELPKFAPSAPILNATTSPAIPTPGAATAPGMTLNLPPTTGSAPATNVPATLPPTPTPATATTPVEAPKPAAP
jgi:preprotein translocase subunit SecG